MSYKVCTRCQFLVAEKKKICNTCGGKKFLAIAGTREAEKNPVSLRDQAVEPVAPQRVAVGHKREIVASARPVRSHVQPMTHSNVQPMISSAARTESDTGRSRVSNLRDKFNVVDDDDLKVMRWEETWSKLRSAFMR